jgi:hypothetical protein
MSDANTCTTSYPLTLGKRWTADTIDLRGARDRGIHKQCSPSSRQTSLKHMVRLNRATEPASRDIRYKTRSSSFIVLSLDTESDQAKVQITFSPIDVFLLNDLCHVLRIRNAREDRDQSAVWCYTPRSRMILLTDKNVSSLV